MGHRQISHSRPCHWNFPRQSTGSSIEIIGRRHSSHLVPCWRAQVDVDSTQGPLSDHRQPCPRTGNNLGPHGRGRGTLEGPSEIHQRIHRWHLAQCAVYTTAEYSLLVWYHWRQYMWLRRHICDHPLIFAGSNTRIWGIYYGFHDHIRYLSSNNYLH